MNDEDLFSKNVNLTYEQNPQEKIFDSLDKLESNGCIFEEMEEITFPDNPQQFILQNINYNNCTKILASVIYYVSGDVRKGQRIIFSPEFQKNDLLKDHEWVTFLTHYSLAYGVNTFSLTDHDDRPVGKYFWKDYPNALLSSGCLYESNIYDFNIADNYCIAAYNYFQEHYLPHPYISRIYNPTDYLKENLEFQSCLNSPHLCQGLYKTKKQANDMLLIKRKSPFFLDQILKDLSYCVDSNLDCKILFLEPSLYGYEYKYKFIYTFECPDKKNENDSTRIKKRECITYNVEPNDAKKFIIDAAFNTNNSTAKVVLADMLCWAETSSLPNEKQYNWKHAARSFLIEASFNNYRALRHLANHYRDGTCGFKINKKKYYEKLLDLVEKYNRFHDYMEWLKSSIYGIGTTYQDYLLIPEIFFAADYDSFFIHEINYNKVDFKYGLLSKEELDNRIKNAEDMINKYNKEDKEGLSNYRALEILSLLYLEPLHGYEKDYEKGIKYGEKLISKYLNDPYSKVNRREAITILENNKKDEDNKYNWETMRNYSSFVSNVESAMTPDTKKIFRILADIYSGKIETMRHKIDLKKAIKYYNFAYDLGDNEAYFHSDSLMEYIIMNSKLNLDKYN